MTEPLDLDEAHNVLADNGIDGPDQPYNPRALAAMRMADRLLAEVERLTAELAEARAALDSALRAGPVIAAVAAWRHHNPGTFRAGERLAAAWDAYTAGKVEVPPTPTTDAEIEALPRLIIPAHGIPADEALNLARYIAKHAVSGRTDPGEGEQTHEASIGATGVLTEWRAQWISRPFGDDREREEGRRDFTDEAEARAFYEAEKARALGPYWRIELRQRGTSPWAAVLSSGYGELDARETHQAAPDAPRGAEAGEPTAWDVAWCAGYAMALQRALDMSYEDAYWHATHKAEPLPRRTDA